MILGGLADCEVCETDDNEITWAWWAPNKQE